jgi:predicted metal-binding protein
MTIATLFVCKSCQLLEQDEDDRPTDGTLLLTQLLALHATWTHQADVDIQPVGCLWTCRQGCAVALQGVNRCTYLFTHLPADSAIALIQFSERYLAHQQGNVPWKQIPDQLKTETIARIPSIGQTIEDED